MSTSNNENNVLHAIYGGKTFMKFKTAIGIEKVNVDFVDKENPKDGSISIYLDMVEFGSDLIRLIKNGQLEKALYRSKETAKQNNQKYPAAVWYSSVGGSKINGNPVSRYFSIAPGSAQELVFTANLFPAEINELGAYISKKGAKPIRTIRVGGSMKDLYALAYAWDFFAADYMSRKFSVDAMSQNFFDKNFDLIEQEKNDKDAAPKQQEPKKGSNSSSTPTTASNEKTATTAQSQQAAPNPAPQTTPQPVQTARTTPNITRATLALTAKGKYKEFEDSDGNIGMIFPCIAELNGKELPIICLISGPDAPICETVYASEQFKQLFLASQKGDDVKMTANIVRREADGKVLYLLEGIES